MTTAFVALLAGVAGAALLLALGAHLWVNRAPPADERFDEYGRVPLFGVDLSAGRQQAAPQREFDSAKPVGDESNDDSAGVRSDSRAVADRPSRGAAADEETSPESASDRAHPFAPPIAQPITPSKPADVPRPPRTSWGATPGWPIASNAGMSETPKYVAPINPDPLNQRPVAPAFASNGNGNNNRVFADGVPGAMIEGHQLRFSAPAEGTLQFLPGRLEISSGLDTGREIRFVRVPGANGTEVTFGRNAGPLYRHIQLRDQTVSREHARLAFAVGGWTLTNLSQTNPVAHNGRILGLAEEQPLGDGDRLEMGEVVFNFRSR